ncbi:glycosyltransferase family 4 protein [Candidatus Peregrinibacteria bacterium]|nr:glycosyltransferase family 4 protein [Candidatus Peregrinibacteria bacterium]
MKIGIDLRTACANKAGKGWYTYFLVKELLRQDRKNEYILYTDRLSADISDFYNSHIKVIRKHSFLWHFAVIKDFKKEGGDLFFSPTSFIIPAFLPKNIRSVITVHDLVAFLHPSMHQTKATLLEKLFLGRALRKAERVLVPSHNTKVDLVKFFKYPEEKITVTPLAADEVFSRKPTEGELANVHQKYNLPDEFVLAVLGLEPRKNVVTAISAIELSVKKHAELKLVIVGGKGWKSKKAEQLLKKSGHHIIHIESCSPAELPIFYRLATALVYPSLYEGFGLPPLEAMASGCPVICSNAASLPEVCGDAAISVDPNDIENLSFKINQLIEDKTLQADLIKRGLEQAKKFSWTKTAELTLRAFI